MDDFLDINSFYDDIEEQIEKNEPQWQVEYAKVLPEDKGAYADNIKLKDKKWTQIEGKNYRYKNGNFRNRETLDINAKASEGGYYGRENTMINSGNYLEKCEPIGIKSVYDEIDWDRAMNKL